MSEHELDFDFPSETLMVEAHFDPGFPGSRETPREPKGYSPQRVYFRGIEITHVLTKSELDKIERRINEA